MPELIEHPDKWIGNYPQVVNSPVPNGKLSVPDPERPGNKSKFLN